MRSVDYLPRPTSRLFMRHGTMLFHVFFRRDTFSRFPLAKLKPVSQHKSERFRRRAARVAGKSF